MRLNSLGVLVGAISALVSQQPLHAQQSEKEADLAAKGPYAHRPFARIVGAPFVAAAEPASESRRGTLVVDPVTKKTNELIILLNYDEVNRLQQLVPSLHKASTVPAIERGVLQALKSRQRNADYFFGSPIDAHYLMGTQRSSDEHRNAARAARRGGAEDPRENLERYLVLRYETVEQAAAALTRLQSERAVESAQNNEAGELSAVPNDPYFSPPSGQDPRQYQWGMFEAVKGMNFVPAWDKVRGQAYIAVMDGGWGGLVQPNLSVAVHPDLVANNRPHMQFGGPRTPSAGPGTFDYLMHSVHVAGIIGAENGYIPKPVIGPSPTNQGYVAGACPTCSFVMYSVVNNKKLSSPGGTNADFAVLIKSAVDAGMQVINWSGGLPTGSVCNTTAGNTANAVCESLRYATGRGVLVVSAAGNFNQPVPQFPGHLSDGSSENLSVLPVAATDSTGARWYYDAANGSAFSSRYGVAAPGKSIVSTFVPNGNYNGDPWVLCADIATKDESAGRFSNGVGDGVSSCTGTSMAAPHVSALAGLIRSIDPRATATAVRNVIRQSGSLAAAPTDAMGYGIPNADKAVTAALAANTSRLTPLFGLYSPDRKDSFYTTVPQMANAAIDGNLMPRNQAVAATASKYTSMYGTSISGYSSYPRVAVPVFGGTTTPSPSAEAWIFTTELNPKNAAVPLSALMRMSWKCGDPTPAGQPAVCTNGSPAHIDTVLVESSERAYFEWLGYKLDGIEGFVYPKTQAQPAGTVKLMRKYNPTRDDHAVFPATATANMTNQGYTNITNSSDWLGYVYPNTGPMPTIQ